jgi:RND family efflux transporter MFP subunit
MGVSATMVYPEQGRTVAAALRQACKQRPCGRPFRRSRPQYTPARVFASDGWLPKIVCEGPTLTGSGVCGGSQPFMNKPVPGGDPVASPQISPPPASERPAEPRKPASLTGHSRFRILFVASPLILHVACSRPQSVRAARASEPPAVAVAKVQAEDLSHGLVLTAEFKPFQQVDVMAKVAGYVKQINVDVGDRVRQGQLLATLEIPEQADDLARAKAAVERSIAEVARERDELRRAESAHEISHVSFVRLSQVAAQKPALIAQQEIDDSRSKDLVSEAQIAAARSSLAAAQQQVDVNKAELAKVKTLMSYARVTAPFTGVVTKRYADTGSMIQAGTASQTQAMPLVRLSQNSLLRLILPVPESAVPGVHIGQQVEVRVQTLNRSFSGRVARFADRLQMSTRTMDTEVDVANPALVLIPGMYAEVNLTLDRKRNALAIPVAAVDIDGVDERSDAEPASPGSHAAGKSGTVMVVTADNQVDIRKVVLGLETANRVEVRSGLRDGELVVIGNRGMLQPGQRVRPKVTTMGPAS